MFRSPPASSPGWPPGPDNWSGHDSQPVRHVPWFVTVSPGSPGEVTRKSLVLFAAASVIWFRSLLFIRVAVEHIPPAVVVFGRTALGAAFLVPLAARRRGVPRPAPGDRAHCRRDPD